MNESIASDAISLLEECITNGKSGKDALYAWFSREQVSISSTIKEFVTEEKRLLLKIPKKLEKII
jgi:hypothetical protein